LIEEWMPRCGVVITCDYYDYDGIDDVDLDLDLFEGGLPPPPQTCLT
jgi:hypothetical protein